MGRLTGVATNKEAVYLANMKATVEFDDALFRRLKIEAARRGRTIRDLVAEGVLRVLDAPEAVTELSTSGAASTWRPAWFGSLAHYGDGIADHSLTAVRESIDRHRDALRPVGQRRDRQRP